MAAQAAAASLRAAAVDAHARGDVAREVGALEDLSRDAATADRAGEAVAFLARIAEIQRVRGDREARLHAVVLAGRVLCEAWGVGRDVPAGMVMLLWAEAEARRTDASLAAMLKDYLTGFQYTLTDREFSEVEPWLLLDPAAVVDATLARYLHEHAGALP